TCCPAFSHFSVRHHPRMRMRVIQYSEALAIELRGRWMAAFTWHDRRPKLRVHPLEHQRGVGAAEAEGIRQHGAELGVIDALAHDWHVGECRIELGDVGALADEA